MNKILWEELITYFHFTTNYNIYIYIYVAT
jgi:hypothetical protein